jgi:hypothetical protein
MQVGLKASWDLENKLPTLSFIPYQNISFRSTSVSYPDLFGVCEDHRKKFQNLQPNIRNLQAIKIAHYHSKILPGEGLFKQRATWIMSIQKKKMREKRLVTHLEHKSELLGNKNIKSDQLTEHYIISAEPSARTA